MPTPEPYTVQATKCREAAQMPNNQLIYMNMSQNVHKDSVSVTYQNFVII